jgi:predicted nucleotidyltransferase
MLLTKWSGDWWNTINLSESIFFGSSARGEAGSGSDLDFLVVLPDDAPREAFFDGKIYERLWDIPFAIDIVPFRHKTFDERSGWLMSLPAIALGEGKLEYDAATVSG